MGKMTDLGGGSASARIGRTLNPFSAPLFTGPGGSENGLFGDEQCFFFFLLPYL